MQAIKIEICASPIPADTACTESLERYKEQVQVFASSLDATELLWKPVPARCAVRCDQIKSCQTCRTFFSCATATGCLQHVLPRMGPIASCGKPDLPVCSNEANWQAVLLTSSAVPQPDVRWLQCQLMSIICLSHTLRVTYVLHIICVVVVSGMTLFVLRLHAPTIV